MLSRNFARVVAIPIFRPISSVLFSNNAAPVIEVDDSTQISLGPTTWTDIPNTNDNRVFDATDVLTERRRLLYRSRQTGWRETDLLLGEWASLNLDKMEQADLQVFGDLLKEETPYMFNIITGQDPTPEHLEGPLLKQLKMWVQDNQKYWKS